MRSAEAGLTTVTALPSRVAANVPAAGHGIARNPGMKLDFGFLESMRYVNRVGTGAAHRDDDQTPLHQRRTTRRRGCCAQCR